MKSAPSPVGASAIALIVAALLVAAALPQARAAVIQVPADHLTISDAIAVALDHDTIQVAAGTYAENLVVQIPLVLLGPNAGISPNTGSRVAEAVISPAAGNGITVAGTDSLRGVKISGFQFESVPEQGIRAAGRDFYDIEISYNLFTNVGTHALYTAAGIPVVKDGATQGGTRTGWLVHENRIEDYTAATVYGLNFSNCWNEGAVITNNVITDATGLGAGRGLYIEGASDLTVANNTFENQTPWALFLSEGARNVDVQNNTFEGNDRGLLLASTVDDSDNPFTLDQIRVSGNQFVDHASIGVDIIKVGPGSGQIGAITIDDNGFTQDVAFRTANVGFIEAKLDSAYAAGLLTISNNTFQYSGTFGVDASAAYGMRLRGGGITAVNVVNNVMDGGGITGSLTSGIFIKTSPDSYGLITAGAVIQIMENVITGFNGGVIAYGTSYGELPLGVNVAVSSNDLSGNGQATRNYDTQVELINAHGNWWGSHDPTAVATAAGAHVAFSSWLDTDLDTEPGTPGFQGDFSVLFVDDDSPEQQAVTRIQQAVDLLTTGGTIHVEPGLYEEQVEIDREMDLLGAGAGTSVIQAPPALSAFFTTSANNYPVVFVHDVADVTVSGFTVDGLGRGNANYRFVGVGYHNAGGTIDHCTIVDVRDEPIGGSQHGVGINAHAAGGQPRSLIISGCNISGFQKNAMALTGANLTVTVDGNTATGAGAVSFIAQNGIQISSGATGSISNNNVTGFSYEPATWASTGVLAFSPSGAIDVIDNDVSECQIGIWFIDAEGRIEQNTVTNTVSGMGATPFWWCIIADPGEGEIQQPPHAAFDAGWTDGTARAPGHAVDAAALTTFVLYNEIDGGGNGTGIEADALGTETLNFTATGNVVTNCEAAFVLYAEATAFLHASVRYNSLSGNYFGLSNQSGQAQDACANWWGDASGPMAASNGSGTGDSVSTGVTYAPWLGYGDADPATFGFQADSPMQWHTNGTGTFPLTKAVNLSAAGDTIFAWAGEYVDNVIIDKQLVLLGQGADSVILYPAISDPGAPGLPTYAGSQMMIIRADGVVIDGVTLDGDHPSLTPPGTTDARNGIITDPNNLGNWDDLVVTNCVIRNMYWRGVVLTANNSTSGHVVRDNALAGINGHTRSTALELAGASGEVVGNEVTDAGTGIAFVPGTTSSVTGGRADSNTISGCARGIVLNNNSAPVAVRDNLISDGGAGVGIQLLKPISVDTISGNSINALDTGLAIHGGLTGQVQVIANNTFTGLGAFGSVGVYASTALGDTASARVVARLSGNAINDFSYGILLHERTGETSRRMDVIVGGTAPDENVITGYSLFGLFLANCNDFIDARFNDWGDIVCEELEDVIYHQVDDPTLGLVDYTDARCTVPCAVALTGDVNTDATINSSDIIYLVNYTFKGGPIPQPVGASGDVNCTGDVNAGDIIYLVNYTFKGGPAPCDVCGIL